MGKIDAKKQEGLLACMFIAAFAAFFLLDCFIYYWYNIGVVPKMSDVP